MGELHEIVDIGTVERLFSMLAVAGPVIGAIIGALVGARRRRPARYAIIGLLIGLTGTLNWLLWRVYNAITSKLGLDSVRNLAVNLVLFVIVGLVIGVAARLLAARCAVDAPGPTANGGSDVS